MKSVACRMLCRFLIASLFAMSYQPSMAGIIGTDQASSTTALSTERAALIVALSRTDVAGQLCWREARAPRAAKLRVASMTDREASALSGKIDLLPAGANSGTGRAVAIVVVLLVWYFWK